MKLKLKMFIRWTDLRSLRTAALVKYAAITILVVVMEGNMTSAQEAVRHAVPAMPADRTMVYVTCGAVETLRALPFEIARTPFRSSDVAKSNKTSYVDISGEHSTASFSSCQPKIYLFLKDGSASHPPFLVALKTAKGTRRVTALTEKGRSGYAIATEEIVKPHYRVLGNDGGMAFMEISPRSQISQGEYAIIGTDLTRTATFSIK
jgi:hypothetical protein